MFKKKQFDSEQDGYKNIEFKNHDKRVSDFVNSLKREQIISITDHDLVASDAWFKETIIWYEED